MAELTANENTAGKTPSILNSIRDNLLKPMALEIEDADVANRDEIIRTLGEGNSLMMEKIRELQTEVKELKELIRQFGVRIGESAHTVKWNE